MREKNPIDEHIGKRLRASRKNKRLSQAKLAEMLGISHQQVQLYESGSSRVAASTLLTISDLLNVSPGYFYEGYEKPDEKARLLGEHDVLCTTRYVPLNILLIEDDAADEAFMREAIHESNVRSNLHVVRDGIEALDFLRDSSQTEPFSRPDIVLLDLNIPKREGIDVLKEIKRDADLKDIPVIVLSGSLNPKDMYKAYQEQACSFIPKSLEFDQFKDQFEKVALYWSTVVLPSMQETG